MFLIYYFRKFLVCVDKITFLKVRRFFPNYSWVKIGTQNVNLSDTLHQKLFLQN